MTWGNTRGSLARQALPFVPAVRRVARAEFHRERRRVHAFLAREATMDNMVTLAMAAVQRGRPDWQRAYRRIYVTIGVAFAEQGVPPAQRSAPDPVEQRQTVGVGWGDADDPWWRDVFRPRLGGDDWWDPWLASTIRYANTNAGRNITSINRGTQRRIQRAVAAALASGEGIHDTIKRIDRLYLDKVIPNRSEVIARTETLTAARAGEHNATVASGWAGVTVKSWLATGDARTRQEHAEAERLNRDVPFTEPFHVGGERLMFPGDASLGASAWNVIQCRCDETKRVLQR